MTIQAVKFSPAGNKGFLRKIIDACVEEYPDIPIAIHCDHGDTIDLIKDCIADGYTSVMIDGSHHPYEKNVELTEFITSDPDRLQKLAGALAEKV